MDQILLNADLVKQSSVFALRRKINRVPRDERGLDWAERLILIFVAKNVHRGRVKALKRKLQAARYSRKDKPLYQDFTDRMKKVIETNVLSVRQFNFSFDYSDKEVVAAELKMAVDAISGLGYEVFINSGTLLGAVRGESFISHDNDVDLAVLLKGDSLPEVLKNYYDLYKRVRKLQGVADHYRSRAKRPVFKLNMKSGVRIDVFPAYILDGKVYVWPHTFGELERSDVLPLTTRVLHGHAFPAPKDAEKMLALNYGENWREPDPSFVFPWGHAERRFSELLMAYRHDRRWDKLKGFLMPWTK